MISSRRLAAEGIGSVLLAATVVGSGVMAERLAAGNTALALLANTVATVAVLAVLVALFAPVSGAHFNPAVTLVQAMRRELTWQEAIAYGSVQIVGCSAGALLAHAMFALLLIQLSLHARAGPPQWLSEGVATFGLLLVILGSRRSEDVPWRWRHGSALRTGSPTSFANPAITIARSLSNTFAGIRPHDVPGFIAAQCVGAIAAYAVARLLFRPAAPVESTVRVGASTTADTRGALHAEVPA